MCENDGPGVIQSLTVAFDFPVVLLISPVVTFEYMFQIFGRNTESVVFYPDLQMPGIRFGTGDLYLHLLAGVFEGIVDKILEDGEQKMIISCNDRVFRPEVDLNIDLFVCLPVPTIGLCRCFQHFAEIDFPDI